MAAIHNDSISRDTVNGAPRFLTLRDGRTLAWTVFGDPEGAPVLYAHGFPASRLEAAFTDRPARGSGMRVLAADRPGVGASDPCPGRRIVDWADDAATLLDHLDIARVRVLGVSGGAPYALACATAMPERVAAVSLAVPLGPLAAIGTTAGLSALGRMSARLAWRWPGAQAALFHGLAAGIRWTPVGMLRLLLAGTRGRDRILLAEPELRAIWARALRTGVRQGAHAAIEEMRLYVRPWGFRPADVAVPVDLWHGDADTVVPSAHARWLAGELPDARLHCVRHGGHISVPVERMGDILAALHSR